MPASSRTTKKMWLAPPVTGARQLREIDARGRRGRDRPRCRLRPVAAIDEAGRRFGEAGRLRLRQRRGRGDRRDPPRAQAAVVAHAVNRDLIGGRIRLDLEAHRRAAIDAHVGRKALDVCVARAHDVPFASSGSRCSGSRRQSRSSGTRRPGRTRSGPLYGQCRTTRAEPQPLRRADRTSTDDGDSWKEAFREGHTPATEEDDWRLRNGRATEFESNERLARENRPCRGAGALRVPRLQTFVCRRRRISRAGDSTLASDAALFGRPM